MTQEVQAESVPNRSGPTDPRFKAFVDKCLILDLEIEQETEVREVGALWRDKKLHISGAPSLKVALRQLEELGAEAEFIVGHNIVAHDRPFIKKYLPKSPLLNLPVVDTLYLSPLAFPQRPYHKLVKDYKLISAQPNNPLTDCKLTLQLLEDCWEAFRKSRKMKGLLSVYRSCFNDSDSRGEESKLKLKGTGLLLQALGGQSVSPKRVCDGFVYFAKEKHQPEENRTVRACPHSIRRHLPPLLTSPKNGPAVAYSLAWLRVAGTESVLPRRVHHRFPAATELIRKIRGVSCQGKDCGYCSIHHEPVGKLQQYFDFKTFRAAPATTDGESLQKKIVEERIAGESVLAIMPTGGGKSVGFQLPAIVHNEQTGALTVVISPLQALMKDQVENLNSRTESPALAATLNGLQTMIERREVLDNIMLGSYAVLYISPEQLRNTSFRSAISQRNIASWVFDEAHCISKWGHDFRPDYLYAARFIKEFSKGEGVPIAPIACFTATAKSDVRQEIRSRFESVLGKDLKELACDRIDRDNLRFSVEETSNAQKVGRITELLNEHIAKGSAIIYARSRRRTELIAERLRSQGWNAEHFHGGLNPPEKKRVQDAFISGETPVIVATNAFGMGIDKPDVRLVIHADVPSSIENYLQEAGRAGRDRQPASCVLLFAKDDLEKQFDLVSQGQLTKRDIAQILRAVRKVRRRHTEEIVVSPGELLRTPDTEVSFDSEDRYAGTRVRTAIAWLERAEFVLRNENRTRLYQGVPAVRDLAESRKKIKERGLRPSREQQWMQVLNRLQFADPREGIEVDQIAVLPSFESWFESLERQHRNDPARANQALTQHIFRTLHEMTLAGVLESGLYFSAWIHHKRGRTSPNRLKEIDQVQEKLVDLLRNQSPETGPCDEVEISIAQLQEQLRARDLKIVNDSIFTLLKGWTRKIAGHQALVTVQSRGRGRLGIQLEVSWDALAEQLRLRTEVGQVVLEVLGNTADQRNLVGERLVRFSLEELHRAVKERLGLSQDPEDLFIAIEKTLLFLDEHQIIRLERGLSVFRQAMTLRMREESKGKTYTANHYRPLEEHYAQRVFQVHAIGRYVEESQKTLGSQVGSYVDDYFRLTDQQFKRRYFPGELQSVKRATSTESYRRIVENLENPAQEQIVTAPKDQNLLVLAGPGSGKTRVVVHRAAYLLLVERIRPERLLVICFNRSAMHELRVRLRELVGDPARRVAVHTYHSLALRLTESSIVARLAATSHQKIDFDEIIKEANRLLSGKEQIIGADPDELRDRLLSGFEYLLVDEYQDIDQPQYQMISHIARRAGQETEDDRRATILAVGDDDQNIYAWRGANVRHLQQFEEDFKAKRHYLVENYRSTKEIIATSNALIQNNHDRMKASHPIRINPARSNDRAGGRWERPDPHTGGRVSRIKVQGPRIASATLAEIERLKGLKQALEWDQFAVLAWSHADLAPVRAQLEKEGVPVRRAIPAGLPRLDRIREFKLLLNHLEMIGHQKIRPSKLRKRLQAICKVRAPGTVWTTMADPLLSTLQEEAGNDDIMATQVIETIHQGLADHHRSHLIGRGVLVGTIHAAKGLEFGHVLVLGGQKHSRDKRSRSQEEMRRLYYVAMTRARQTLTLIDCSENPNPYFDEVRNQVMRRPLVVANGRSEELLGLEYQVLGMKDVYLDYAGAKGEKHPIHRVLLELQAGDRVSLGKRYNGRVQILNQDDTQVGCLSRTASLRWPSGRLASVDEVRVLGMVSRTRDDSCAKYRDRLKVDQWEVPILEVRTKLT